MAIVTCRECKCALSDSAISCPNCGYPYEKNYRLYLKAKQLMEEAKSAETMIGVSEIFFDIRGFRDAEMLAECCRRKADELSKVSCNTTPNPLTTPNPIVEKDNKFSLIAAILFTVIGVVILWSSTADEFFYWSFANSSLSGGTRHYDGNFSILLSGLPAGQLIVIIILTGVAICILLAWIIAIKNKRLELYCVIVSSVVLGLILVCSIAAPASFTEHENFGLGFYSYKDFENYGRAYYVQIFSSMSLLAISVINRIKSFKK